MGMKSWTSKLPVVDVFKDLSYLKILNFCLLLFFSRCLGLYLDLINQGSYSFNAVVGNILVVLPHIWSKTGGCLQLVPVTTSSAPAVTSVLIDNFATQNINVAYKQTSDLVGGGTSSWSSGALQINPSAGSYFTTVTATCANVGASALSYIQVVASVPAGDTFNVVVYATNSACNGLSPTAAQNVAGNQYLVSTSSSGVSTFLIPITTSLFPNGIWAINLQQWSSSATVTLYSISFTSGASTAATTTTTSAAASSATSIVIDNFLSANVNSAYHQTSALVGGGTSSWSSGSLLFSPATGGYFTSTTATCANTNAALPFIQFTAAIPAGETFSVVVYATNSACNGVAPTASQNTAVVSSTSALTTYRVPLTASLFPNGIWSVNLQSWSSTAQIQITSISFSS